MIPSKNETRSDFLARGMDDFDMMSKYPKEIDRSHHINKIFDKAEKYDELRKKLDEINNNTLIKK